MESWAKRPSRVPQYRDWRCLHHCFQSPCRVCRRGCSGLPLEGPQPCTGLAQSPMHWWFSLGHEVAQTWPNKELKKWDLLWVWQKFQYLTVEGCVAKLKQAGMVTLLRFFFRIFSTQTGAASIRTPVQLYLFSKSSVLEKSSPSRPPHSMKVPPCCYNY